MNMCIDDIIKEMANHEPRNLDFFLKAVDDIKSKNKEMCTMVELGCGEAHYSAIFNEKFHHQCKNVMVEPYMEFWQKFGKHYFQDKQNTHFYNNYICDIIWAGWGGSGDPVAMDLKSKINKISFNEVLVNSNTSFIDILHMDLQGAEYYVLKEMIENQLIKRINYIFIMTHTFADINYHSYLKLLSDNNLNDDIIFTDSSYIENGDGLLILKVNNS